MRETTVKPDTFDPIHVEDALKHLVIYMRSPQSQWTPRKEYNIWLPEIITRYIFRDLLKNEINDFQSQANVEIVYPSQSPSFVEAAWELCRRGVLRPGPMGVRTSTEDISNSVFGYSLTLFGKKWITEADFDEFVPTEPERFGQVLSNFATLFGFGFQQRGQEAIRCYGAHAYLSCCAMCGAAAESILLATAIKKTGDEAAVLRTYRAAHGRVQIEKELLHNTVGHIRNSFPAYTNLINYWRDESAHGTASEITDNEAYTSLALLSRFALLIKENWPVLTSNA